MTEPKILKPKNVLITAKAYDYLINELGLKPSDLLVKMVKDEDRIKSPKTNKFIHIGTGTYMKLLADYTEEELLLRRDGFINSPDSSNLIRVFGKTFNQLLLKASEDPKYSLENLLKNPRMPRGDEMIGVKYNKDYNNNDNEKLEKLKTLKKQHDEQELFENKAKDKKDILSKKSINKLIKLSSIMIYHTANFKQYDEEKDQHFNCFYNAAGYFEDGKLVSFYEAKELRVGSDELEYHFHKRVVGDITNIEQYEKYLYEDNEESLHDFKILSIDLMSLKDDKEELINIVNDHYEEVQSEKYFNLISQHLWFFTNAKMMTIIPKDEKISITLKLVKGANIESEDEEYNDKYETFKEIIDSKRKLRKDIELWHEQILNYIHIKL